MQLPNRLCGDVIRNDRSDGATLLTAPEISKEDFEEGLSAYFGRPVRIVSIEASPLDQRSTHSIERLILTFASGEWLSAVFKRLQPVAGQKGHRREVLIYRRLLTGQRFDAPGLYASAYDERRGRYWMLLEDLGDDMLNHGDLDDWSAAVRWLAKLHGTYFGREDDLRALECLHEHDAEYYRAIAREARENLESAGASSAVDRLDRFSDRFEAAIAFLVDQPRTLVHGDLFSRNFLIQPGNRVRPIDWESAAIGLPIWDLTRLLSGWERHRPSLFTAYMNELMQYAPVSFDERALEITSVYCQILDILWYFRWSDGLCSEGETVEGLLNTLDEHWRRLDGGWSDG
jgi:hypothetical protein